MQTHELAALSCALQGFQSADGTQHTAITGLVNVARALGLKVMGGRGSWGRARDAAIPNTGEAQQDNLDTGDLLSPTLQYGPHVHAIQFPIAYAVSVHRR